MEIALEAAMGGKRTLETVLIPASESQGFWIVNLACVARNFADHDSLQGKEAGQSGQTS